jgi:pyruvate-formate lyase
MRMNPRIQRLRKASFEAKPCISIERAVLETAFYRENYGKYSLPVLRAMTFKDLCEKKTITIGEDELIVGERGPFPKAVSTFPELTCHSAEDLHILNERVMANFSVSPEDIRTYEETVIPYWQGRSMRDRVFNHVPKRWRLAYEAGMFTEFMEQRAPGHTALDGSIYQKGMRDFKSDIAAAIDALDYQTDPEATDKAEQLKAMDIACDAAILFAERHADLALEMAAAATDPARKSELEEIAAVCRRVPAEVPRTFHEALQMYWFVHLGTITELNGWDAMSPGHLDQHLFPFYSKGAADGSLDRDRAKELLGCFWIKFNNQPAPPKVGVTAKESGTYNDFTNINLGGVLPDGSDGVQRSLLYHPRGCRRVKTASAPEQHPGQRKDPGPVYQSGCPGHPQWLWLSVRIQRRRGGHGTGPGGQDRRGRQGGRLQRLYRNRRLWQGSLYPHRLSQCPQDSRS